MAIKKLEITNKNRERSYRCRKDRASQTPKERSLATRVVIFSILVEKIQNL